MPADVPFSGRGADLSERHGLGRAQLPAHEDAALREEEVARERVYEGRLLKIDEVQVRMPDGSIRRREVIRHPGAVALIALDDQGRVLMEHQMRTATGDIVTEIPAGKIDPGETPAQTAVRELSEETGYAAGSLEYLFPMGTAIGYSDEIIHFFLATDLRPGNAHRDEGEFLTTFWMEPSQLLAGVLDGSIYDSKTMVAALYLAGRGSGAF